MNFSFVLLIMILKRKKYRLGNIINYLEKKGNISFRESPFNEVDNLVLCQLSYVDFAGIVPDLESGKSVTIQDANEAYLYKHYGEELSTSKSLLKTAPLTLKAMAKGKRYKNAKLSCYANEIDEASQKQFSALKIELGDGTIFIAFRGTDDNIVAWQESYNLCYEIIPSQIEAAEYLENAIGKSKKKIRIGGHSKGGNLAVYAAMKSSDKIRKKIVEIFNNDGPGFTEEIVQSYEYKRICGKITRYTPEFSIFGSLFEHDDRHIIVSSNSKGIQQHDLMNWEISGSKLVYLPTNAEKSVVISDSIIKWINDLKKTQRKAIGQSLFGELRKKGMKKVYDISVDDPKNIYKILGAIKNISKPTKSALSSLLFSLFLRYNIQHKS